MTQRIVLRCARKGIVVRGLSRTGRITPHRPPTLSTQQWILRQARPPARCTARTRAATTLPAASTTGWSVHPHSMHQPLLGSQRDANVGRDADSARGGRRSRSGKEQRSMGRSRRRREGWRARGPGGASRSRSPSLSIRQSQWCCARPSSSLSNIVNLGNKNLNLNTKP